MRAIGAVVILLGVSAASWAQTLTGGWIADPQSGCRAWDNYYDARDTMKWQGSCVDGYADGEGTLQTFNDGKLIETAAGQFKRGKLEGDAVVESRRGQFEGEFRDNRPNGRGSFHLKEGGEFSGTWTNGCFREGGRRTTFYTTAKECGFE